MFNYASNFLNIKFFIISNWKATEIFCCNLSAEYTYWLNVSRKP
jgi:hypothetical protein